MRETIDGQSTSAGFGCSITGLACTRATLLVVARDAVWGIVSAMGSRRTEIALIATVGIVGLSVMAHVCLVVGKRSRIETCKDNLRGIAVCLTIYAQKYGSGYEIPDRRGQAFWDALLSTPSPLESVSAHSQYFFCCPVLRWTRKEGFADYRGPMPISGSSMYWIRPPTGVSVGNADRVIAADRLLNHGLQEDQHINVLLRSGRVESAVPGSRVWDDAVIQTAD